MYRLFIKIYPEITGLITFIVYLTTLSPSLDTGDTGELATVQAVLGIAHPTGYPLFTILGHLFSYLPLPFTTIYKLNLLNALWSAITIPMLIRTIALIINNLSAFSGNNDTGRLHNIKPGLATVIIASVFGGLTFAFSYTFWTESTSVEVYSLQLFVSSLILYSTFKAYILTINEGVTKAKKYWLSTAILLGLGFSNHIMTIYMLPGLIYLFISSNKALPGTFKRIIFLGIISFSVATSLYLLLMFRAQTQPAYMFGDPSNLNALIEHVKGTSYSHYMFQGVEVIKEQSIYFFKLLSFEISDTRIFLGEFSLSILFFISGLVLSYIFLKKLLIISVLIFCTTLFFSLNYSIPDVNIYFLIIYYIGAVLISISIVFLSAVIGKKSITWVGIITSCLTFATIFTNLPLVNRNNNYLFYDYAKSVLGSLEKNSIILSGADTPVYMASLYLQNVEEFRKDIEIIHPNLMRFDWYKRKMRDQFGSFEEFFNSKTLYVTRDVYNNYIYTGKYIKLPKGTKLIPDIYVYKVVSDAAYNTAQTDYNIRLPDNINEFDQSLIAFFCSFMEMRIHYEISFNKSEKAEMYYSTIKKFNPDYNFRTDYTKYFKHSSASP